MCDGVGDVERLLGELVLVGGVEDLKLDGVPELDGVCCDGGGAVGGGAGGDGLQHVFFDAGGGGVELFDELWEDLGGKVARGGDAGAQAVLEVLGGDAVGVVGRRAEGDGEVAVDDVE